MGKLVVIPYVGNFGESQMYRGSLSSAPSTAKAIYDACITNGIMIMSGTLFTSGSDAGRQYRGCSAPNSMAIAFFPEGDVIRWAFGYRSDCVAYFGTTLTNVNEIVSAGVFSSAGNYYISSTNNAALSAFALSNDYLYADSDSALEAARIWAIPKYPITYRDTNTTHFGPDEATIGDTVSVNYIFPDGYGIANPSADVYVTNNGVVIPSQYANGTLTFTMPDPS